MTRREYPPLTPERGSAGCAIIIGCLLAIVIIVAWAVYR